MCLAIVDEQWEEPLAEERVGWKVMRKDTAGYLTPHRWFFVYPWQWAFSVSDSRIGPEGSPHLRSLCDMDAITYQEYLKALGCSYIAGFHAYVDQRDAEAAMKKNYIDSPRVAVVVKVRLRGISAVGRELVNGKMAKVLVAREMMVEGEVE